jgi:hypothetical protein
METLETLIDFQTTWLQLGWAALGLSLLYALLKLLERWLALGKTAGPPLPDRLRSRFRRWVGRALVLFDLLAMAVLGLTFVFIHPLRHGLLTILIVLAGFSSLRNFINGRLLLLDKSIAGAEHIRIGKREGRIAKRGRFGIYLRTVDGLQHVPYTQVVEQGFALVSGGNMGSFRHFYLKPQEKSEAEPENLPYLLAYAPYLERERPVDLTPLEDGSLSAKFILRQSRYLPDLIQLLNEAGWEVIDSSEKPAPTSLV